jgi:hypothetical protein
MLAQDEVLTGTHLFDDRHDLGTDLCKLRLQIKQWHGCHAP